MLTLWTTTDFRQCSVGGVYLSGHPQCVTHLHLTADPAAWTGHPLHLHLALLYIHHTVVPIQYTQQYTEPPPTHTNTVCFYDPITWPYIHFMELLTVWVTMSTT